MYTFFNFVVGTNITIEMINLLKDNKWLKAFVSNTIPNYTKQNVRNYLLYQISDCSRSLVVSLITMKLSVSELWFGARYIALLLSLSQARVIDRLLLLIVILLLLEFYPWYPKYRDFLIYKLAIYARSPVLCWTIAKSHLLKLHFLNGNQQVL